MYARHGIEVYEEVRRLSAHGLSDYEVSRRSGVARATVQNWRQRTEPPRRVAQETQVASFPAGSFVPADEESYAYLLGVYLGDGYIWQTSARSFRLGIYCDSAYPGLIEEVAEALAGCVPGVSVRRNFKMDGSVTLLLASSPLWGVAFPQHGPGRKHERPIRLEPWQRAVTRQHPRALLRGLVHSDGSRVINRFKKALPGGRVAEYAYPRYFFSNLSRDIREIFCEHCELLGVRWAQSNPRNISVSHRDSVAILDSFIGPKT